MRTRAVGTVAAGFVHLALETAQQQYGLQRAELLDGAALDEADVADASRILPSDALWDLFQLVLERSGDLSFGLRMAETLDLRTQGFWGYALLASLSLRQRIQIHLRYQQRRSPAEFTFCEEHGTARLDVSLPPVALAPRSVFLDWGFATVCITHRRRLAGQDPQLQLWMDVPEQPHHRELRALAGGSLVFSAPCNRIQFPAAHLDMPLSGDKHLGALARAQLDAELERSEGAEKGDLVAAVRGRLIKRLASDASLQRIAADLRMSERTLRRELSMQGSSFQQILDELRRTGAEAALRSSDESVDAIGVRLGYPDPSNFRRAFRRWTGMAPSEFRAQHRRPAPDVAG
ncbi:MAG TPA: AraC family transcriptional regulator ligand-binding domain-containing protein [Polyangiales bacterium]